MDPRPSSLSQSFPLSPSLPRLALTVLDGADLGTLLLEPLADLGFGHARRKRLGHIPLDGLEEITEFLLLVVNVFAGAVSLNGLLDGELVLLGLGIEARVDFLKHADAD